MRRRRTFGLLAAAAATVALGACQNMALPNMAPGPFAANPAPMPPPMPPPAAKVAVLLPLTGQNAGLGQAMLKAVQLAMDPPGSPPLDVRDTLGTPAGAAAAARDALAGGDRLIIGPLTAPETGAVAPQSAPAGIGVLAFTSDPAQARPGVWTLGLTPGQQVRRTVFAAQSQGKTRVAALLPDTAFGSALAQAATEACAAAALPPPQIRRYATPQAAVAALDELSDTAHRRGARDAQLKALQARTDDPTVPQQVAELNAQPVPPPPFDVLLLGAAGPGLQSIAPLLAHDDIRPPEVRVLGPALWANEASRLPDLAGAWYAAPDPALRAAFVRAYQAKYQAPPPALADLAYDAGSLARVLAAGPGTSAAGLTRPDGFAGVDGVLALQPDGHVRRGLALFELGRGSAQMVEPSPQAVSAPGF